MSTEIVTIIDRNGVLVVDSRLVAEKLGIQHKNFIETIEKNRITVEEYFGAISFEAREFKTRQGNTSSERIFWLSEDQATFLMTLSRNTPEVIKVRHSLLLPGSCSRGNSLGVLACRG